MMIAVGCDHGGFELLQSILKHLDERHVQYKHFGTLECTPVDYPGIAIKVGAAIVSGECEKGLLVCGTGIGMSIAANKIKGIRAAACSETFSAKFTRLHNDSNVLCLGGRVVGSGVACDLVDLFLDTAFEGGRHKPRIDAIMEIENI